MDDEVGPTVRKLQSNVESLREETETFQSAAAELRQRREQLQRSVELEDRLLAERRSALAQFHYRLKSQGLLVGDCENRVKVAEQDNVAVQAELTELRKAIADEKRQRLDKLDTSQGHVQALVKQFHQAASIVDGDAARSDPEDGGVSRTPDGDASQEEETEVARACVAELHQTVDQLSSQLQTEKVSHRIPQEVKRETLRDAKAAVEGLVDQLQAQR